MCRPCGRRGGWCRRVCGRFRRPCKILSVCSWMRIVTKMRLTLTTHRMTLPAWKTTRTPTGGDGSLSSQAASPRLGFASGCFPAIDRPRRTRRRALARPWRRSPALPSRQGRMAPRGEDPRPRSRQRRNHPPRRRRVTRPPRRPRRLRRSTRAGAQVPRPTRRAGRAARRATSCSACSPASPATLRASCPASACTPSRHRPPPARSATDRARCISS
jgi:hypothetical protein